MAVERTERKTIRLNGSSVDDIQNIKEAIDEFCRAVKRGDAFLIHVTLEVVIGEARSMASETEISDLRALLLAFEVQYGTRVALAQALDVTDRSVRYWMTQPLLRRRCARIAEKLLASAPTEELRSRVDQYLQSLKNPQ